MGEEDTRDGTAVQASTIGDVDPEQPAPTDTYLHLQAPTYCNQQAAPSAEATSNKQPTPSVEKPKVALETRLPDPTVKVESKALPLTANEAERTIIKNGSINNNEKTHPLEASARASQWTR